MGPQSNGHVNGQANGAPSKLYGDLHAFSPPLGLDPSACVDKETVLTVTPASMGTDTQVTDASGAAVVVCESKWMSSKKTIKRTTSGETLFTIHSGLFDSSKLGADATGKEAFEVTRKSGDGNTKISIRFKSVSTARPVEIMLESADKSNTTGHLVLDGRTVGWVTQEYKTMTSMPLNVTLAAGVDLALLAAVSICLSALFVSRDVSSNGLAGTMAQ